MKKYLFIILLGVVFFTPRGEVHARRLFTTGFELDSTTAGVEYGGKDNGTLAGSATTTVVNSGTYSWAYASSSGGDGFYKFLPNDIDLGATSTPGVTYYARAMVYVKNYPNTSNREIISFLNSGVAIVSKIYLLTDGTLQWVDNTTQYATTGSLSLNTWYRLEMSYMASSTSKKTETTVKLDGAQIYATTTDANNNQGINTIDWGRDSTTADTKMNLYIDDVAVNDSTGSNNNSWPGVGKVVELLPTGAGDSGCTSGNFNGLNSIPPVDATSTNTCNLGTATSTGSFNMTDSATVGINSYDTITVVYPLARVREASTGATNWRMGIKSASGGASSTNLLTDAGDTTVRTNPSSTVSGTRFLNPLTSATDPTTGVAWTPTGTNSIDNMQLTVMTTDGSPQTWVTGLYATVEYVPGTPPANNAPVQGSAILRLLNSLLKLLNGLLIVRS